MDTLPGLLDRRQDVELDGRSRHPWYRRAILALLAAFCLLALFNYFGQRSHSYSANGPGASIGLRAPSTLRGGDIFEARFEVRAASALDHPVLVLAPGWLQGITLNTIEPAPADETGSGGRLRLTLAPIRAGGEATLWTQWQVNPTGFGSRDTSVELFDGAHRIAAIERTTHVLP
jgi:hypothetical protein